MAQKWRKKLKSYLFTLFYGIYIFNNAYTYIIGFNYKFIIYK
jgi:hypothetical protein